MPAKKQTATEPAWEEISPRTPDYKFEEIGDVFIGVFKEIRELAVPDPNADEDGATRMSRFYECTDPDSGEPVGFWGSALLDYKWDKAEPPIESGQMVKVIYKGKQDLEGGRTARQFELFRTQTPF